MSAEDILINECILTEEHNKNVIISSRQDFKFDTPVITAEHTATTEYSDNSRSPVDSVGIFNVKRSLRLERGIEQVLITTPTNR